MSKAPTRLPSYQSAVDFIEKPNIENGVRVFGSWVGRSIIVAVSMGIAGKSVRDAVFDGMIAASAIEVFVLGHAVYEVSSAVDKKLQPPT